jgi:hypothetical protein
MNAVERALRAVDDAVDAGKITAGRRSYYLARYGDDPVGTQSLIDSLTAVPEAVIKLPDLPAPDDELYAQVYGADAR